jgi:hypothetical protein
MPTILHFVGAEEAVTLAQDYGAVNSALQGREAAEFKRLPGDTLVAIYKAGVAYIEDASESESPVDLIR